MSCYRRQPIGERLEFHRAMQEDYRHVDRRLMEAGGLGCLYELVGRAGLEGYLDGPTWGEVDRLVAALRPWADECCWSPLLNGEVYDPEEHGQVPDKDLTPCGGCHPCTFRAALGEPPTAEGRRS